jgi:hypothetical protein
MTKYQIKQRNKRIAKRDGLRRKLWGVLGGLAIAMAVLTGMGAMDWSDEPAPMAATVVAK